MVLIYVFPSFDLFYMNILECYFFLLNFYLHSNFDQPIKTFFKKRSVFIRVYESCFVFCHANLLTSGNTLICVIENINILIITMYIVPRKLCFRSYFLESLENLGEMFFSLLRIECESWTNDFVEFIMKMSLTKVISLDYDTYFVDERDIS